MLFSDFAKYLQDLENNASRLKMTEILALLLQKFDPSETAPAIYLMQGSLVPDYESLEFSLSVKMTIRALARLKPEVKNQKPENKHVNLFDEEDYSTYEVEVNKLYKQLGDLGLVAQEIKSQRLKVKNTANNLKILEVYQQLVEIARDEGTGSQERKVNLLVKLFEQVDDLSAKFITRIVIGKLRLGFSKMTILDALSWSLSGDKSLSHSLEEVYNKKADIGRLAQEFLQRKNLSAEGLREWLVETKVEVGIPVVPALCQRLNSAHEIVEKMGLVMAEPKFDGMRLQLHFEKNEEKPKKIIKAFTRNLEEVSQMFPELQEIAKQLKCESCILDGEVIGVDLKTGKLVAFQETITRKRKHEITLTAAGLPVRYYVFDILFLNGKSLIDKKLQDRKELLKGLFIDSEVLQKTEYLVTADPNEVRKFHEQKLAEGLEGAVVKAVDSEYVAGRKGWNWVKIKEHEGSSGKLNDTLDLIVMGYYRGRGKRAEFGIGAFLTGILDDSNRRAGKILTIAKIGTGISDAQLTQIAARLDELKTDEKPKIYEVHKNLIPDVWVEPKLVVEIAADELTNSPVHTAGQALRFPRLIKLRNDKSWEQATTLEELKDIQVA